MNKLIYWKLVSFKDIKNFHQGLSKSDKGLFRFETLYLIYV